MHICLLACIQVSRTCVCELTSSPGCEQIHRSLLQRVQRSLLQVFLRIYRFLCMQIRPLSCLQVSYTCVLYARMSHESRFFNVS